jgi:hypothetical protein
MTTTARRLQITIDCADPDRLVRFWALALDYVPAPPPSGHDSWGAYYVSIGVPEDEVGDGGPDSVVDPAGVGPRIWFQQVPEAKVVKNRVHIDIDVTGGRDQPVDVRRQRVDDAVARLVEAGASVLRPADQTYKDHYAVVMRDPEGNEFCVH